MAVSSKYTEFNLLLKRTIEYFLAADGTQTPEATRLAVSLEEINELSELQVAFTTAYDVYAEPTTKTQIATANVKTEYKKANPVMANLQQRLKNGYAELTDEDYAVLGIHKDKTTRTPKTIPATVPMPVWVSANKRQIVVDATEQTAGTIKRVAVPDGCRIAIQVAIMPQDIPPTDGDYKTRNPSGKSRFTLDFDVSDAGKNAYVILAYQNNAGRGNWSQPLKAIII